jgi:hypothetical protein
VSRQLTVGQQQSQLTSIGSIRYLTLPQAAFSLTGFFRQNMTGAGFVVDKFSRAGSLEALGSGSIGFDFWHFPHSWITGTIRHSGDRPV